jgi:hypothetical protein
MPIALIVQLAAAIIGQTGTVINLVEYLKAHPDHKASDPLPVEHQVSADNLVAALQAHIQGTAGAPALPWAS